MTPDPLIPLGSGGAQNPAISNKARLLDAAAARGAPVPVGFVLRHEYYEALLADQLIREGNGALYAPDPERLEARLARDLLPRLPRRPLAVRSAFAAEDGDDSSMAGFFQSKLFVDAGARGALARALLAVWGSALRHPGRFRRDLLLMSMVEAVHAGVAFTESAYQDDLINFSGGTADRLVSGHVAGEELWLPQLQAGERPSPPKPPFAPRLQTLLRRVRRIFGRGEWDVEWADDGRACWLVQIRPITRPPRRNEAFTYANIREIMPDPPSPFMSGIVAACAPQLFAYYRQFDPALPTSRPIIELFAGRPLFNITLLTDMMRSWGLPTRLVTSSIGGRAAQEAGFRPQRFLRKSIPLLKQGWAQLTAVGHSRRATKQVLAIAADPGDSFIACVDNLTALFALLVTEMFNLTAALSLPLLILRQSGTLAAHNARHHAISTAMYTDLEPLRRLAAANPALHLVLKEGTMPADAEFQTLWRAYMQKHGHRGAYESDIARRRYHEAPAPLLQSLVHEALHKTAPPPPLSLRARLTGPVWWHARRVLNAREWWRYQAMVAYDALRRRLLALAADAVRDGRLPHPDALWLLDPADARRLDEGACFTPADIAAREQELAAWKAIDMPDLMHRFDDLEAGAADKNGEESRWRGVSLTEGVVEGRAWVLAEPAATLPPGFDPAHTILVTRSIDAGWIPTFGLVAGAVVEIGGDLSHGSIILRELGLPAITNAAGAARALRTGNQLRLEAGRGVVSLVNGADSPT